MKNYATPPKKDHPDAEIMGQKRQEKALREFKHVLKDLIYLLRTSSQMETVYMYWINRSREQFVLETKATVLDNTMFKDRIHFEDHFLNEFKDIQEPTAIELDKDISGSSLSHYYNEVPVQYITLLPFVNNGETVALTVMESKDQSFTDGKSDVVHSYINALGNVLNTYLEISDLYDQQQEWIDYEASISELEVRCHRAQMIRRLLNTMQSFLNDGGVSFVTKGMNEWCNVLNSDEAKDPAPVGMRMEQRSLAYEAVENGKPEFAIHFNNNPKRLSPRELHSKGATMAIPLLMKDRRQGVVLVHDKNPLIFKESTKHKFINLVRIAGLQMLSNDPNIDLDESIFAHKHGAFLPDLWEVMIDAELKKLRNEGSKFSSWFGLITLSNLPEIRTKLRLEQLRQMQRDLIRTFNPNQFGFPGILGFHSDYVYSFFIQSNDEKAVQKWTKSLKKEFSNSFELNNGIHINTGIKVGFVRLNQNYESSYQILSNAKSALSKALKPGQNETG